MRSTNILSKLVMKNIKTMNKIYLSILFFLTTISSFGQKMFSTSYTMNDGLSANRIYSIVQDSCGFIWIGTDDGLNRFDGIHFKNYQFSNIISETSSNSVRKIFIDSKKRMWVGLDNGIVIYNPQDDSFTPFNAKTKEQKSIKSFITDILEDKDHNIWIATNGDGVFKFTLKGIGEKGNLKVFRSAQDGLIQDQIMTLCEDSKGNIWMGSYSKGISCYNKQKQKFVNYTKENSSLSDNSIQRIIEDSHGNIWIGTFQQGIDLFNEKQKSFTNFNDNSSSQLLYHIHDMLEYAPGMLLIAADNGANYFNTESKTVLPADAPHLALRFRSNKFIYSMFIDREESLWLGSYFSGVEFISIFQSNFNYYTCGEKEGKVINAIVEDKNGNCYIGTDDNGIFFLDIKTRQIKPFHTAKDIQSTYYCIHDLLLDDDILYAATYERGLEAFHLKTGKKVTYLHNSQDTTSLPSSKVFKLYKASNGKIYIGTATGMCYFNTDSETFHPIHGLKSRVQTIVEDHQGIIWAGSNIDGLIAYDIKNQQSTIYTHNADSSSLPKNSITTLAIDNKKRLWIGTLGQGLCLYDKQNDKFIRYNHLPLPNQIISSIIPKGNVLWISTNKGLISFNPDQGTIKTYSQPNGLSNEQFTPNAGIEHSNGEILLGTSDGFCIFQPQNLQENSTKSSLILTDISLFGQALQPGPNSPLKQSTVYTHELDLSHAENMISFNFALLSYIAPQENEYQYMLEGVDKNWQKSKGNKNQISYSNLAPGEYTLRVKGSNSDQIKAENELMLHITIHPPFLLSLPAYILYGFIILALLFWSIRSYIRRSQKKQNAHLMRLNNEKEKELYNSKIEFFTNIAHEIRTPLSLIIGPLDYLMKTTDINSKYGEYLGIIEQNYKRLYTLVNQLLDFRKVDSGSYKLNYQSHNLLKLVQEVCIIFELGIKQKRLTINTSKIPADTIIFTDEEAFTKIISNLLSNAIKYAHTQIDICYQETNDGYFDIIVTDDGIGIPDQEKNKIFEAFYQVKNKGGNNKNGVGIGLHMTYALVQLMEGQISVEDRTDNKKGVSIKIHLPLKKNSVYPLSVSESGHQVLYSDNSTIDNHSQSVKSDQPYTLMIVDDNPEVLDFLSKVLSTDYFVISAQSGEEALQLLDNNKIDLIISDVMMEGINGFELCGKIKNNINLSHIPVILLTAKTDTESKIAGLDSGADAYIEKPFTPSHLIAQLQNLLRKKEALQKAYATNPLTEIRTTVQNELDEKFIQQCSQIILNNIDNSDFTINSLAQELMMSRTSVFTKIKGISGMTPNDFIKVTRLKAAAKMLVEGKYRISEIGFLVGFSSSSYFAKCFYKQFGMLPTDFVKHIKESE